MLYGDANLSGDALIEFKSGQITTVAADSALDLIGSRAFVADASDTSSNSALKGLKNVAGGLQLEDGATVTRSGGLINSGVITLDGSSGDGGSVLTVNGTLTNSGTISIGDAALSAESTVEAAKVVNDGTINLDGNGKSAHATLRCEGPFTNDGSVNLSHDTDTIGGAVDGTGDFSLSNTSTLQFVHGVSSGETVTFQSGVNHLFLDSPSSFYGTIDDFSTPGDSVIAKTFAEAATMLTYTQTGANSCSWTLTDATHTAVLHFAGEPYTKSEFSISPSVNGNTLIKFV